MAVSNSYNLTYCLVVFLLTVTVSSCQTTVIIKGQNETGTTGSGRLDTTAKSNTGTKGLRQSDKTTRHFTDTKGLRQSDKTARSNTGTTGLRQSDTTARPNAGTTGIGQSNTTAQSNTGTTGIGQSITTARPSAGTTGIGQSNTTARPTAGTTGIGQSNTTARPTTGTTGIGHSNTTAQSNTGTTGLGQSNTTAQSNTGTTGIGQSNTTARPTAGTTGIGQSNTTTRPTAGTTGIGQSNTTTRPTAGTTGIGQSNTTTRPTAGTTGIGQSNTTARPTAGTTGIGQSNTTAQPTAGTTGIGQSNTTAQPTAGTTGIGQSNTTTRPNTGTTGLGQSNTTARPNTGTTGLGQSNTTALPNTGTTGLGQSNTTSRPNTATTGLGQSDTTALPNTGTTGLTRTDTIPPYTNTTYGLTHAEPSSSYIMNTGLTRSETTPSFTDTTGLTQTDTFTQPYTSTTGLTQTDTFTQPYTSTTGLTQTDTFTQPYTSTTGLTQTDTFTQPYTSSTGQGLTTTVPTDTNATGQGLTTTVPTHTNATGQGLTTTVPTHTNATGQGLTTTVPTHTNATGPMNNYTTSHTPTHTTISNTTSILPQNNSTLPSPTTIDVGNHTSTSFYYTTERTTTSWGIPTTSMPSSSTTRNRSTTTLQPTSVVTAVTFETTVHGGNCAYEALHDKTIMAKQGIWEHKLVTDLPTCWNLCLDRRVKGTECVAAEFTHYSGVPGECFMNLGDRLLETSDVEVSDRADSTVLLRRCLNEQYCPADGVWPPTSANVTRILPCPKDYLPGHMYRRCNKLGNWLIVDSDNCTREDLHRLKETVKQILQGNISYNATKDVLKDLVNSTENSLTQGDVKAVVDIMEALANISSQNHPPDEEYLGNFVSITENVFNASADVWSRDTTSANRVLHAVEVVGVAAATNPSLNLSNVPIIATESIALKIGRSSEDEGIGFPDRSNAELIKSWIQQSSTSAFLSVQAIPGNMTTVPYSAVLYRDLSQVLPLQADALVLNSAVLSFSLPNVNITEPIRLTFEHLKDPLDSSFAPSCRFLQFGSDSKTGKWSTEGCTLVTTNHSVTVCECDHLTNFAILMSSRQLEPNKAYETLSEIGCSISICCLIITLIVYRVCWRYIRSDRNVILANMYVTLVLAYVTLLAGAGRTSPRAGCTVVAVLMHYLWLAVFCLMLCEGLDLFFSVIIVFPRARSNLPWLLLMAYGAPVIIVAISMGATQLYGYGGTSVCWLSTKNGQFWAFAAPALAIILANYIIAAIVIRVLLKSKARTSANWSWRQKTKSVVRSICVLSPVLGLAWVFGFLNFDSPSSKVFQALFICFNSLQGFFIFILHCVMSKQVRDGICKLRRQYEATKTSSSRDYVPPSFDIGIHSGHYRMTSNGSSENQIPTTDNSELGALNIAMLNFDSLSETASKHEIV